MFHVHGLQETYPVLRPLLGKLLKVFVPLQLHEHVAAEDVQIRSQVLIEGGVAFEEAEQVVGLLFKGLQDFVGYLGGCIHFRPSFQLGHAGAERIPALLVKVSTVEFHHDIGHGECQSLGLISLDHGADLRLSLLGVKHQNVDGVPLQNISCLVERVFPKS